MRTTKVIVLFSVLLASMLMASDSFASGAWSDRPGTINNAMTLADGVTINLDAVCVEKIRGNQNPAYFVARECFDPDSRIVVLTTPPTTLHYGQTVDITGILTTLSNGYRAVENPSVYGYLDANGNLLYRGPLVKGIEEPTPWPWKALLNQSANQSSFTNNSVASNNTVASLSTTESTNPPGPTPTPSSDPAPIVCASIAAAKTAYNTYYNVTTRPRVMVTLQCDGVSNPATGSFTLLEDGTGSTITVYATTSVTTTDRIKKITATILKDANNTYWLEVDAGPSWQSQDIVGSIQKCASGTIAWAKTFPNGTTLPTDGRVHALVGKHIAWCDGTIVYIEEPDRSNGILLNYALLPDDDNPYIVDVDGTITLPTNGDESSLTVSSTAYTRTGSKVSPLGMNNKSLAYEPSKSGLLIKTWGKVTAVDSNNGYIYINDGSNLSDGTQTNGVNNVGVRVLFSDNYYPVVGDYAVVKGPLGATYDYTTGTYVKCIKTNGLLDMTLSMPAPITDLSVMEGNATVGLYWNATNTSTFHVYRSLSQTGQYTLIGTSTTNNYSDNTVTNGTTYWYKVAGTNCSTEGTLVGPVSATPTASAPLVSISSANVDSEGMLTLQSTGSCSGGSPLYTLSVDDEVIWSFDQGEISNIHYDTTQLPNGSHKIQITSSCGDYNAVALQNVNVQNFISEFNVPDDMCGLQPISATFQSSASWTLTIAQGTTTLYTTSGTGTAMNVAWDAGSTYGDFDVTLTATPAGSGGMSIQSTGTHSKTVKSRKSYSSGGDYYAWSSLSIADPDSNLQQGFAYMAQDAADAWSPKYGVSIYSGMLTQPSDWSDVVIDTVLNGEIRCNNLAIAAHGIAKADNPKNPLWQGVLCANFPGSGSISGLTAFVNATGHMNGSWTAVGPAIGNTINWNPATGRVSNWDSNRRLRFVYLAACRGGQGIFSLAFGTPRGRYPGRGRAFLGFRNVVYGASLLDFCDKFWGEWSKSNVNVAQAASRAYWYVKKKDKKQMDYALHGDPNLFIK